MDVIDETVLVVVDAVVGDLVVVAPQIGLQIRVANIRAAVDNGNDGVALFGTCQIPGLRSRNLLQVILQSEKRIIRRDEKRIAVTRFGDFDCR